MEQRKRICQGHPRDLVADSGFRRRQAQWLGHILNTLTQEHDPGLQESSGLCLPVFCWERPEGPESLSAVVMGWL